MIKYFTYFYFYSRKIPENTRYLEIIVYGTRRIIQYYFYIYFDTTLKAP